MKYVIRADCFTLNIDINNDILSTTLLDFAEEVRGKGMLYEITNTNIIKGYSIYVMSNSFSDIYPNSRNLNIVINGHNKKNDRPIMSVKIPMQDIKKIKALLIKYTPLNKLKIL